MAGSGSSLLGASISPKIQQGFVSDGKLMKFRSPFPHGSSSWFGGEFSLDFKNKEHPHRTGGELGFTYLQGMSKDHTDQSDLPLGDDPVANLLRFSNTRDAESHFMKLEWRWPAFPPLVESRHWRVLEPRLGLGMGLLNVRTRVQQMNSDPKQVGTLDFLLDASTQVKFVELRGSRFGVSLGGSLEIFVGKMLGIMGGATLGIHFFKPD